MSFKHQHNENAEWTVNPIDNRIESDGVLIASLPYCDSSAECHTIEHNAKLISQSPKLLEFAEMFYDYWKGNDKRPVLLDELEKTIEACGVIIEHK